MDKIINLALRAIIDSLIFTRKFFDRKINFENNLIMSKALFGVTQPKQNKNTVIIINKGSTGSSKLFFQ